MKLIPTEPPGRITRKARQFEAEIAELRSLGYTLAAIRRTLAAAGVQVSISTVRREATRQGAPAPSALQPIQADKPAPPPAARPDFPAAISAPSIPALAPASTAILDPTAPPNGLKGKHIAEAFAHTVNANPFFRSNQRP